MVHGRGKDDRRCGGMLFLIFLLYLLDTCTGVCDCVFVSGCDCGCAMGNEAGCGGVGHLVGAPEGSESDSRS